MILTFEQGLTTQIPDHTITMEENLYTFTQCVLSTCQWNPTQL